MGAAERSNENLFLKVYEEPLEGEKLGRNLGEVDVHAPLGAHPGFQDPLAATASGHREPMLTPSHGPGQTPDMSAATGAFRFSGRAKDAAWRIECPPPPGHTL